MPLLSPRQIEGLIANGHCIVILHHRVLQLDRWLDKHPGGKLVLAHMVGRDASDEIDAYHLPDTIRRMNAFQIGHISAAHPFPNFTPPIRGGVFRPLHQPTITVDNCQESELDTPEEDSATSDGEASTLYSRSYNSSNTSIHVLDDKPDPAPIPPVSAHLAIHNKAARRRLPAVVPVTPEAHVALLVQQEITADIRHYPSLDPATQHHIARRFHALHDRVKAEGYYDCRYSEYAKEGLRYALLFAAFLTCLFHQYYLLSAVFLGLFWHQIMFTAHDAGHRGITQNFVTDTLIGMFIADLCCGLSIGWWKSSHNVHHLITNHPEHDPDIQNLPLFSNCPTFFKSLTSTYYDGFVMVWDAAAALIIPWQKYLYYPIMGLARFNLYFLSWLHLLSPRSANLGSAAWTRPAEMLFMATYWFLYGYCLVWRTLPTWPLRVAFVFISHIMTMPLHVQITLSHWGMSTADLGDGESFAQRQLRTTMDVDCPAWMDFVHGGLQFQAIHHLFPRVPRHNLRRLQALVIEFCQELGVEYQCLGFVDGNRKVLSRLDEVSRMADMLMQCQSYMARTGESGLH